MKLHGAGVAQITRENMYGQPAADEWPIGRTPPEVREIYELRVKAQLELWDITSDDSDDGDHGRIGPEKGKPTTSRPRGPPQTHEFPTPPISAESSRPVPYETKPRHVSDEEGHEEDGQYTTTRASCVPPIEPRKTIYKWRHLADLEDYWKEEPHSTTYVTSTPTMKPEAINRKRRHFPDDEDHEKEEQHITACNSYTQPTELQAKSQKRRNFSDDEDDEKEEQHTTALISCTQSTELQAKREKRRHSSDDEDHEKEEQHTTARISYTPSTELQAQSQKRRRLSDEADHATTRSSFTTPANIGEDSPSLESPIKSRKRQKKQNASYEVDKIEGQEGRSIKTRVRYIRPIRPRLLGPA